MLRIGLRPDRGDGRGRIGNMAEVGNRLFLPAGIVILGHPAAGLVVAGVADLAVVNQKDPPSRPDGLSRPACGKAGHPLIALAMVIGTHVEPVVILTVVPADDLTLPPNQLFR